MAGEYWDVGGARPPQGGNESAYNGNSGSRRALRFAAVVEAEAVERTKLQRIEGACRESCRITIWAVRRGPSVPPPNTLSSRSTLSSIPPYAQTPPVASHSLPPRPSLGPPAFT